MKFKDIMIVSDLDGTLLNDQKQVGISNQEHINEFVLNDGVFAIATGRTPLSAKPFLKNIKINGPCIFYNGSIVYDSKMEKILAANKLDKVSIRPFIEMIIKKNKVIVEVYSLDRIYIVSNKTYDNPIANNEGDKYQKANLDEIDSENWYKVLFCSYDGYLKEVDDLFKESGLSEKFNSFFSHDYYYEITPFETSKGSALESLNISRFLCTIGDQANDLEMIKVADLGVAVKNANKLLIKESDYLSVSNNDELIKDVLSYLTNLK